MYVHIFDTTINDGSLEGQKFGEFGKFDFFAKLTSSMNQIILSNFYLT